MERGFFKVWRKIADSRSYSRSTLHRALMLTLMVRANWKKSWFRGHEVGPGQIATSVRSLAEELKEPQTSVYRALCDLAEEGLIKMENVERQFSLISLVNLDSYQDFSESFGTRAEHRRNTNGTQTEQSEEIKCDNYQGVSKCIGTRAEHGRNTNGTQMEQSKELKEEEVLNPPFNPPSEQLELLPSGWAKPIPEAVAKIPLVDGSYYSVTRDKIAGWQKAYPAIEVETEILQAAAWCVANPKNRKTKNGVERFLVNWLKRAQDSAPRKAQQPRFVPRASTVAQQQYVERDTMARMILQDRQRRNADAQNGRYAQTVDESQLSLPPGWL